MTTRPEQWLAVTRRSVSLAGRVIDESGRLRGGWRVTLAAAKKSETEPTAGRKWQATIRPDGRFFFLDAPGGKYVVTVEDPNGEALARKPVELVEKSPRRVRALKLDLDIEVPATKVVA